MLGSCSHPKFIRQMLGYNESGKCSAERCLHRNGSFAIKCKNSILKTKNAKSLPVIEISHTLHTRTIPFNIILEGKGKNVIS